MVAPIEWDADAYDAISAPQRRWAMEVVERLRGSVAPDATILDVGCGTGAVTERLLELVPDGRVLAIDASQTMVDAAARRLGARAGVWRADALDVEVAVPVDVVFSNSVLHWVRDHDRLWRHLASVLRPGGRLEVQCGGAGNVAEAQRAVEAVVAEQAPELRGWSPWTFSTPEETEPRLRAAGFREIRCWMVERSATPDDLGRFVRTSVLPEHLARLPAERREPFAAAVLARMETPLRYVRLHVSAVREG